MSSVEASLRFRYYSLGVSVRASYSPKTPKPLYNNNMFVNWSFSEYIVDSFAPILQTLEIWLFLLLSDIEERAWVKNVLWIKQLFNVIVNFHIVVSNDALIKVGADHKKHFSRAIESAALPDYLRC